MVEVVARDAPDGALLAYSREIYIDKVDASVNKEKFKEYILETFPEKDIYIYVLEIEIITKRS